MASQNNITDSNFVVKQFVNFVNDGTSAITVDASGFNDHQSGSSKLHIKRIKWSLNNAVTIAFVGTGTTTGITLAGNTSGHLNGPRIPNAATVSGATAGDITLTPATTGTNGFVYLELEKQNFGSGT